MRGAHGDAAKPVDLGNGLVCASLAGDGSVLSLGTVHAAHGFVELTGLPPFDERRRGDPSASRAYRAEMLDPRHAFLRLEVGGRAPGDALALDLTDRTRPQWRGTVAGLEVELGAAARGRSVVQRWRVAGRRGTAPAIRLHVHARLDRPALAEITELDPPAPTGARTLLAADGATLLIEASELPARATIEVHGTGGRWRLLGPDEAELHVEAPAVEDRVALEVVTTLDALSGERGGRDVVAANASADDAARPTSTGRSESGGAIVDGALAYVRGCTALVAGDGERAILTDHRLLPLSWTRDAYWQALLLLATGDADDAGRVADHLRWLWRRCERPDGRWLRSHHADGRRKDLAFQADQQLYPMLELADFWRRTGSLPDGVAWTDAVATAWRAAELAVDPAAGLMATTENAADDPAEAPFIAASQVMLWYAAERLAELCDAGALGLDGARLRDVSSTVRRAFEQHLVHDGRWAYAVEPGRRWIAYHDANDLPIAFAPVWGFCAPDDGAWRGTMAFALSAANPGYADGPMAGLGSAHTAGAWTLGDAQAWLFATLVGDANGARRAMERLERVAFADGLLPEAYRETGGDLTRVRHWFAWPGAVVSALLLLHEAGALRARLRVAT